MEPSKTSKEPTKEVRTTMRTSHQKRTMHIEESKRPTPPLKPKSETTANTTKSTKKLLKEPPKKPATKQLIKKEVNDIEINTCICSHTTLSKVGSGTVHSVRYFGIRHSGNDSFLQVQSWKRLSCNFASSKSKPCT